MRVAAHLALLATLGAAAGAQQAPNPAVDRLFAEWDRPDSPGCAVSVVRDGRAVYRRGYGMANLDYDVPNGPDVVYYVGSVSKQFTATAVAMLALDGKLSLDDDVRRWFPELPDYGARITVRHLVHHTSGLRDIYALMDLRGDRLENLFPDSAALALIARQRGLAFPPGAAYSYSNSGYFLLGLLVKRASGRSLREFADARIFRPLGMTRTHFHDEPGHVMKRRAVSYAPDPVSGTAQAGGWRVADLPNFDKVGAGGLYTTLDDLRKWDENFYSRHVGGDALHALLHTRGVLASGDTITYAFGNSVHAVRGLRAVEHGGSLMGYRAHVLRFPDQRFSVLVACNAASTEPGPIARSIADAFLAGELAVVPTAESRLTPPPNALARPLGPGTPPRAGAYHSDDLGVSFRVTTDGTPTLVHPTGRAVPIVPNGSGAWRAGGVGLRFSGDTLVLRAARLGDLRLLRAGAPAGARAGGTE